MYFVYMIRCEDGSLYTGSTDDPKRRYVAHAAGKGAKYTRSHKPAELAACWAVGSKSEALKLENRIKKLRKQDKEKILSKEALPDDFCL